MARKKKRGTEPALSQRSQTRNDYANSTAPRPLPGDLGRKRGSFRQLVTAAEAYIQAGGYLFIEARWWTDENEISSAVLSDRDTAMVAAVLSATEERDRETVQA